MLTGNMLIFITGPSAAGKSTVRDYYCKKKGIKQIPALTTRPARSGEKEIHKSVSIDYFTALLDKKKLCLVSENHGYRYGYMLDDIIKLSENPTIIEVDSQTAIKEQKRLNALIVRVIPYSVKMAASRILLKQNGTEDRLNDLYEQMDQKFLSNRRDAGDIIFINKYDRRSLDHFCELMDSLLLSPQRQDL